MRSRVPESIWAVLFALLVNFHSDFGICPATERASSFPCRLHFRKLLGRQLRRPESTQGECEDR